MLGVGVTYFGGALTGSLRSAIDELGQLIVGDDPLRVEAVVAKLRAAAGSAGPGGIFHLAQSALDMALWGIRGKALNLPLWQLLGGARDRVPTYASGALMRGLSLDRVVTATGRLRENGFREMKTQPATARRDHTRQGGRAHAAGARGDRTRKLMCDINQRWRVEQAIDIARRVEDAGVGLFWLEDVMTADDYPDLARVAAALATPVAGGEYVWGIVPFRPYGRGALGRYRHDRPGAGRQDLPFQLGAGHLRLNLRDICAIWPTATTWCPSRARPNTIARPSPRKPPVTIATRCSIRCPRAENGIVNRKMRPHKEEHKPLQELFLRSTRCCAVPCERKS